MLTSAPPEKMLPSARTSSALSGVCFMWSTDARRSSITSPLNRLSGGFVSVRMPRGPEITKRTLFMTSSCLLLNWLQVSASAKLPEVDECEGDEFEPKMTTLLLMPCPSALNGLHLCEAAIHKQFRSRDVAAVVRCEKHHGLGDLIGCTA